MDTAVPPRVEAEVGFIGPLFTGTSAPTAEKPQSKLWHHDGTWWGVLFTPNSDAFTIHRLDWVTQKWIDTGVMVDSHNHVKVDVLSDQGTLYVVSAGTDATNPEDSIRLYRFSYNPAAKSYSEDPGYPVMPVSGGAEAVVMDKDSTGIVWLTYTRNQKVHIVRTDSAGGWLAPYILPVPGADNLTPDDISAVVAFGGDKVGVLWSNQTDGAYYFAVHVDGDPDGAWTREVAYAGPKIADDHMNVKQLQGDPQGRVFATVKTSLVHPQDPLIVLLVRTGVDTWDTDNVVARKAEDPTRGNLLIDGENNQVYTFTSGPCCSGGEVYVKSVSIQSLANGNPFDSGPRVPFISSSLDKAINNPTSTKQTLDNTTNLVMLAGDDPTMHYLHNVINLGPPETTAPETTITSGPEGVVSVSTASFGFASNEEGAVFACGLDGAAFMPCTSPVEYVGLADGDHTFAVRATGAAGNVDTSPALRTWTVHGPLNTFLESTPPVLTADAAAAFTFGSNRPEVTFECRLDTAGFSACNSPLQLTGLGAGVHHFEVRAVEAGSPDPTTASFDWTVDPGLRPTSTFPAVADAFVRAESPTSNFGSSTRIRADTSPPEQSYVKFDVNGVGGNVTKATLRYFVTNGSGNAPKVHTTGTGWTETGITWDSKPAAGAVVIADTARVGTDTWLEYDVTSAVTGDGTISFALLPESRDGLVTHSREAAQPPELVIEH